MLEGLDYQAVGLISGLEVHQQLLTREKLFCRCPAGLYTEDHDGEVLRHMRPTLSELGEYDGTALMEFKTRKEIVYLLNHKNVCTYELDDTPPFLVNQEAIDIAIELCLAMRMDIIDEVHIARKQYLDGSIPTGFQRTAIVGMNGTLPFKGRDLTVTHVSVEEDSCREVSDVGHRITWRTDRLGMPLTETVTGPELVTPQEVRDAILLCGMLARSTGRVRVGMGASRQDVNVSVRGGQRVEIKGVPKAGYAVKLVHNEGIRQVNLLRFRDELHRRGMRGPEDIRTTPFDVTEIFQGADLSFMKSALRAGGRIFAVKFEGGLGLAQFPTQPQTTFLDELAGRIRVIACLDETPVVLSGQHLPEFPGKHKALDRLRRRLRLGEQDDFFIVSGPERDCRTAAEEIRLRFVDAHEGRAPGDPPGPGRRLHHLRAHPARPRPHVSRHRLAPHPHHRRAGGPGPGAPAPGALGPPPAVRRLGRAPGDHRLPHPPRRRGDRGRGGPAHRLRRPAGGHGDRPAGQGPQARRRAGGEAGRGRLGADLRPVHRRAHPPGVHPRAGRPHGHATPAPTPPRPWPPWAWASGPGRIGPGSSGPVHGGVPVRPGATRTPSACASWRAGP